MEYNTSARGENAELKARYLEADRISREIVQQLLAQCASELDEALVYEALHEIVRVKYFLEPADMVTEHFNGLGEISIAKALGKDPSEVKGIDLEAKCNGTSSVMTKKILLAMFLNREMHIALAPDVVANATTIRALAHETFAQLED